MSTRRAKSCSSRGLHQPGGLRRQADAAAANQTAADRSATSRLVARISEPVATCAVVIQDLSPGCRPDDVRRRQSRNPTSQAGQPYLTTQVARAEANLQQHQQQQPPRPDVEPTVGRAALRKTRAAKQDRCAPASAAAMTR